MLSDSKGQITEILITGILDARCLLLSFLTELDARSENEIKIYLEFPKTLGKLHPLYLNNPCTLKMLEDFIISDKLLKNYSKEKIDELNGITTQLKSDYLKFNTNKTNPNKLENTFTSKIGEENIKMINEVLNLGFIEKIESFNNLNVVNDFSNLRNSKNLKLLEDFELVTVKDGLISWVQDIFLMKNNFIPKTTPFVVPKNSYNTHNFFIEELIKIKKSKITESYLEKFDGGNIITYDNDTVFIGKDVLSNNDCCEMRISNIIKEELGVENIIWIGTEKKYEDLRSKSSYQPDYHLDLFMNVLNIDEKCIIIFSKVINNRSLSLLERNWNSRIEKIKLSVKKQLSNFKIEFEILEIPIIIEKVGVRVFAYSYSNNVVEIYENKKIVYLPSYNTANGSNISNNTLVCASNFTEGIFQNLGFETVLIKNKMTKNKDFEIFLLDKGGLHCSIKVLSRK